MLMLPVKMCIEVAACAKSLATESTLPHVLPGFRGLFVLHHRATLLRHDTPHPLHIESGRATGVHAPVTRSGPWTHASGSCEAARSQAVWPTVRCPAVTVARYMGRNMRIVPEFVHTEQRIPGESRFLPRATENASSRRKTCRQTRSQQQTKSARALSCLTLSEAGMRQPLTQRNSTQAPAW